MGRSVLIRKVHVVQVIVGIFHSGEKCPYKEVVHG